MSATNYRRRFAIYLSVVLIAVLGGFVYLIRGLVRIQITDAEYYREKIADQLTYVQTVKAERGMILDSEGNRLACNVTRYRIFIAPDTIREEIAEAKKKEKTERYELDKLISEKLSEICGVEYDFVYELTQKVGRLDETVLVEADKETATKVEELVSEYKLQRLVNISPFTKRFYLYGSLASNALGFCGADGNGLYGLELYYDSELTGTNGRYTLATNPRNEIIPGEYQSYIEAVDGNNLTLTIDRFIQQVLEEKVKDACDDSEAINGACGIVMNVKTGAILGMATYPDYDCNDPRALTGSYAEQLSSSGLDAEKDQDAYLSLLGSLQQQMWMNKPVSFSYIPGSTFKIITAGIALESKSVALTDTYTCKGYIIAVDGTKINCSNHYGHGTLNFAEGLQQSCNPWFITAGLKIGTKTFYDYVANFGYFERSGIDLPGEGETVFWKRAAFSEMDLSTSAFGQNFKINPIRHLSCIAALANGGKLIEPYIVQSIRSADGKLVSEHETVTVRRVLSAEASKTVANILAEGVAGNGGSRNAYVAGYRVAAKTGTSEKIGDIDEENKICSCVAFAPVDDPEVIMIIIVDSPTKGTIFGSTIAAPYVSEALSEIMPYLGVEPKYTADEEAKLNKTVGDYVGMVPFEAQAKIQNLGLSCETVGTGTVISAQVPAAGQSVPRDSGKIILYLGDSAPTDNIRVPNLIGLAAQTARQNVINSGFNVNITGTTNYESGTGAVVIEQYPAAGTLATKGSIVTLTFRYTNISDD